jgi:GWxTD domain-containing protein
MRETFAGAFVFLLCSLLPACSARTAADKNLDPQGRKFISEVRYLIAKDERETFIKLPPAERDRFIQEFWKKRDLTPETEENEFKDEYYQRIKEANRLFTEGGTPGWLQDRGRVYIMIGAPDQRETYPRGRSFYEVPTEVWYYGLFQIVFVDPYWSGNYRLDPQSAEHLSEINRTQMRFRPRVGKEKEAPARELELALEMGTMPDGRPVLRVKVPYRDIALTAAGGKLESTLEMSLAATDGSGKKVWEYQSRYPISVRPNELAHISGREYTIELPIELEKGDYSLVLELTNSADGSKGQGKISFRI